MVIGSLVGTMMGQEVISETSRGIMGHIRSIWSYKDPTILEIMEKFDIKGRTEIIESILNDIHQEIDDGYVSPTETLKLALEQVEEILGKISHVIQEIDEGIELHKTLWFHRWRTPSYYEKLAKMKLYQQNMGIRYDNLVRTMALLQHREKNHNEGSLPNCSRISKSHSTSIIPKLDSTSISKRKRVKFSHTLPKEKQPLLAENQDNDNIEMNDLGEDLVMVSQ